MSMHASCDQYYVLLVFLLKYSICGKTRGGPGQQCIFDVFLTKPVGVNENLGGREAPDWGYKPPNPQYMEHCFFCCV